MDFCARCKDADTETRVHTRAMDDYHELFCAQYRDAVTELARIQSLMKDVAWYNFETVAREWKHPWPLSFLDSTLILEGHRYETVVKRGRMHEKGCFTEYYNGPVRDAPALPPQIVLTELAVAHADVQRAAEQCSAPYEWAPGGRLYEEMLRHSDGVARYRKLSKPNLAHNGRIGLCLGDPMGRQAEARTQAAAKDLLGGVCGDRSLVRV